VHGGLCADQSCAGLRMENNHSRAGSPHRSEGEGTYFHAHTLQSMQPTALRSSLPHRSNLQRSNHGIVFMENRKCIGCKTCMAACPYNARYFNEETRAVDKCDFCYEARLSKGMTTTACSLKPVLPMSGYSAISAILKAEFTAWCISPRQRCGYCVPKPALCPTFTT
jgi:NAD-dependent dihydropyrimidine dehydrogenase PreA subunit